MADELIRIQLRLNPSQNYLDALIYSVLRKSPLNRSAYLRALLLKHLMEEYGGLGLSPEDQAYIASICPGAANTEMADEAESGELMKPAKRSPRKKAKPAEQTAKPVPAVKEPVEEAPPPKEQKPAAPAHQWSATNLPPCMDMSDFDPRDMIKVNGKDL